jgi:hypothetical protein
MANGMKLLLLTSLLLATTLAIPAAVFPFNSQVPTAARINQQYSFQFSGSTFTSADANLIYSISGQPAWLSLDSATRTLIGTPRQEDLGSSTFVLTAADSTGAAHTQCTLVVVSNPMPILQGNLVDQLAESANLSGPNSPVMTLLPNTPLNFHFRQDSFIDIVQRSLYYYATLTDHTPLPAWLHFDSASLAFSGVTPLLSAFPQAFEVMLIASDVQGFAGSSFTFRIEVGERVLVFVPEERVVRVKKGEKVDAGDFETSMSMNGGKIDLAGLKSAEAKGLPGWMSFDSKTLRLKGDAPDDFQAANVTITVSDGNGDTAMVVVRLVPDGDDTMLLTGNIGKLYATPGEHFEYTIPASVVGNTDATLMLVSPTEATWLHFDPSKRELEGDVPTQASAIITATLNAKVQNVAAPETQIFSIDIKPKAPMRGGASAITLITSRTSPTESSTPPATVFASDAHLHNGLQRSTIAGIVVGVLLVVAIPFALLFLCCRKRRSREGYEKHTSPSSRSISRPIQPIEANSIAVTTELHRDVEEADSLDDERHERIERPPQIALNLHPPFARNSKRTSRFSHISMASSLGNGEDMIRADANIPEWGHESAAFQTPHDCFVPAQMARCSRQSTDMLSSKRALNRIRAKRAKHQSEDGMRLGMGMSSTHLRPRRVESHREARSVGLDATMERDSCGSLATIATGMLSMRSSDFPRPPTQTSIMDGSRSMLPGNEKRKSLRVVAQSDNANDSRSLEEKRLSFIVKKRISTTLSSPLWSASLGAHHMNGQNSTTDLHTASAASPSRRSKRGKCQLTSYTGFSSVQPTHSSTRLSQRIRATFAPNYPRVVTQATLAVDDDDDDENKWETSSETSAFSASSEAGDINVEMELADKMALLRHERSWVLPSPTPPPQSIRRPSAHCTSTPASIHSISASRPSARRKSSISPVAAQALNNASLGRRSRLSETSAAGVSKAKVKALAKMERPRLAYTRSGRPVSVEDGLRLGSLRTERVKEEVDVRGGVLEDRDGERVVTGGSGKAFI